MKIQKIIKYGIIGGSFLYGYHACNQLEQKMAEDSIRTRDNAKMLLKQTAPEKYDSLIKLGIGNSTKAKDIQTWLETEVNVLDDLNSRMNENIAIHKLKLAAKDSIKVIK
jgi:hypothetical protein